MITSVPVGLLTALVSSRVYGERLGLGLGGGRPQLLQPPVERGELVRRLHLRPLQLRPGPSGGRRQGRLPGGRHQPDQARFVRVFNTTHPATATGSAVQLVELAVASVKLSNCRLKGNGNLGVVSCLLWLIMKMPLL